MQISRRILVLSAALFFAVASVSYSGIPEKSHGAASNAEQAVAAAEKSAQIDFEAKPHVVDKTAVLISTITFAVNDPEFAKEGTSPYVNLDNPAKDIQFMDNANSIVVTGNVLHIVIDYPVEGEWEFSVVSANPKGFTKADLARQISGVYNAMYAEEERTSITKVVPMEKRMKVMNRNRTNGKFGIWGHDIGDLVLHTVEIYRASDGKLTAVLGIDS